MKAVAARPAITLAKTEVTKELLLANLAVKDAKMVGEGGLSIEMVSKENITFFIPQPLMESKYYTIGQLEEIETSLNGVAVDLFPIDYNC